MEGKLFYRGRPVEELTKEELTEALKVMTRLWEEERELHKRSMDLMKDLREARG